MGATEEQMEFLSAAGVTHVSYILILYSISFLLYLFVNIILYLYASHTWPDDESNGQNALARKTAGHSRNVSFVGPNSGRGGRNSSAMPSPFLDVPDDEMDSRMNGRIGLGMNGDATRPKPKPRMPNTHRVTDSQQVRDAEEFELEGLISDVDDDAEDVSPVEKKKREEKGKIEV